jgi:hypothetical protein
MHGIAAMLCRLTVIELYVASEKQKILYDMCTHNQLLIYSDGMFKISYTYMYAHSQLLTYTYMLVGSI